MVLKAAQYKGGAGF
jgi:hypothetical protein